MNYEDMSYEEFYNNVMSKIADPLSDENLSKYIHNVDERLTVQGGSIQRSSTEDFKFHKHQHNLSVKFAKNDESSLIQFGDIFQNKCKEKELPYSTELFKPDCWYVIHSDTEMLPIYLEILEEIGREYPDIKEKVVEPPLIVGKINEWIGYETYPRDSFFHIRTIVVNKTIDKKLGKWKKMGADRSNLYKSPEFLEEVRREIREIAALNDIDDHNFAFNKDTKEKFLNLDHNYKVTKDLYSQLEKIASKGHAPGLREKKIGEAIYHYYNYLKYFATKIGVNLIHKETNDKKKMDKDVKKVDDIQLLENKYDTKYGNHDVLRLENKYDVDNTTETKIHDLEINTVEPGVTYHLVRDEIIQDLPIFSKEKSRWTGVMTDQEIVASQKKLGFRR